MILRWSAPAQKDLAAIIRYIRQDNIAAAGRVRDRIVADCRVFASWPLAGRAGLLTGTREWVLAPLPYIVVYRENGEAVEILAIRHAAQRWPR